MRALDSSGKGRHGTVIAPTDGRRHPGFLSAYPETQFMRLEEFATYGGNQGIWAPYYTLHKILAGLLDAHTLTGNTQALDVASKIGDWAHSRLSKLRPEQFDRMWNMYIAGEYGGANDAFASLHALTRKPEYLTVARYFDNRNVKDPTVANNDILDGRHANQHIPQFIGYLRIFEQTDERAYHTAAKNFWDMVVPHRVYSHGGVGVGEILRKRDAIAGSLYSEPNNRNHAETCVVYNMLKLSRNLFFHEPDPKYMNYYEQGLFNQILASRRDSDSITSPEVTYFIPVRPGEARSYGNVGTCCGGTGLENHTKYQDSIYFRSADDATLYVNLYIPSMLEWREKGFTLEQRTRYPFEGASTLTVTGNGRLAFMLRVPSWVRRGYTVSVNGAPQRITATPGEYVRLDRQWRSGDRIEIAMPLSFRAERTIDDPSVQSIFYGPTLLAAQAPVASTTLETGLINVSLYKHFKLDRRFRLRHDAGGGQAAALQRERPDVGAVLRRRSAAGTVAAVSHVRPAARASNRVRQRRFRCPQHEARRRHDIPRRRVGRCTVREPRPVGSGGGAHGRGVARGGPGDTDRAERHRASGSTRRARRGLTSVVPRHSEAASPTAPAVTGCDLLGGERPRGCHTNRTHCRDERRNHRDGEQHDDHRRQRGWVLSGHSVQLSAQHTHGG